MRAPISRNFPNGQQHGFQGPAKTPPRAGVSTKSWRRIVRCGVPGFPVPFLIFKVRTQCECQSLRKPPLSKTFPRLPGRSAVKLLAETTCGCRQARPARARRRRRARDSMRPQKFPSSPARHFAPGRGASQEARRPLAGSLSAGSPLLPPPLLPPPPVAWLPHGAPE